MGNEIPLQVDQIGLMIRTIHGQKVILDNDLARIYGVPTKRLNEQVKRNFDRFPPDFLFQLTNDEIESLSPMRSQFATAYKRNIRFLPYAFTENGAIMAANVLNSPEAVRMSVFVVRAFVQMRDLLGGTKELAIIRHLPSAFICVHLWLKTIMLANLIHRFGITAEDGTKERC